MNLKKLREKRDNLMDELTTMVEVLEGAEVRALTEDESNAFETKKAEIDAIDNTIAKVQEIRAKEIGTEAVVALKEERSKEEIENRALNNFFRGMDLESEERTLLASTSSNQALMPLEISKTIMQKLEEQCPILETAKRFSSKGTLRLIKENSYGAAGLTAEGVDYTDSDVVFGNIELRSWKVTAMCQTTIEMLQNVEIDLTKYLLDVIVRRLSKELNKLFLVGTGVNQPTGLCKSGIEHDISTLSINDFITMQTVMHPDYISGSSWIVARTTFTKIANLMDNNGRPYLIANYDAVNNKIAYTFLGLPIIVDANVPEATPVLLANIGEAYAINVLTDITVRHLTEIGFTSGHEVFAGFLLVDGKTVNEDAVVIGKTTVVESKTKK